MTPAPLAFPSSQVLARWSGDIAGRQPLALGIGNVLVHHVEALARITRTKPLDALSRLLLSASIPEKNAASTAVPSAGGNAALARRQPWSPDHAQALGLERPFLRQLLLALERDGLVASTKVDGGADVGWVATPAGERAREQSALCTVAWE